jgi:hypothetical protein
MRLLAGWHPRIIFSLLAIGVLHARFKERLQQSFWHELPLIRPPATRSAGTPTTEADHILNRRFRYRPR